MKKLLVPTDFSSNAEAAISYAVDLANRFGSAITLVNTYKVYSSASMFVSVESYMERDARAQMESLLASISPRLKEGASLETKVIRGDAIPVITDMAEKGGYGMIIMGTQGASGLKEIFSGSTANGVMKHTSVPVLAIPGNFTFRPIKTIVFAADEAGISHPGVTAPLVKIAKCCDSKVLVFHQDIGGEDDGIDPSIDIFLDDVNHSFHYELDENSLNESINSFVADYNADMLCMVRRKRGFLEEIFHVSATTREVFDIPVPLLILHDEG